MPKYIKNTSKSGNKTKYYFTREDLTCKICEIEYNSTGFSNTKLKNLESQLKRYKNKGPRPKAICRNCTKQQRTHLTCFNCETEKPLSQYSKSQRSNNETAHCLDCMDAYQKEIAILSDSDYSDTCGPIVPNSSINAISILNNSPLASVYPDSSINVPAHSALLINNVNNVNSLPQESENSTKNNLIPQFCIDTYSLAQLIGRTNPPAPSKEYIPLSFIEACENESSSYMDVEKNSISAHDSFTRFPKSPVALKNREFISNASYNNLKKFTVPIKDINQITVDSISLWDLNDFNSEYNDSKN